MEMVVLVHNGSFAPSGTRSRSLIHKHKLVAVEQQAAEILQPMLPSIRHAAVPAPAAVGSRPTASQYACSICPARSVAQVPQAAAAKLSTCFTMNGLFSSASAWSAVNVVLRLESTARHQGNPDAP